MKALEIPDNEWVNIQTTIGIIAASVDKIEEHLEENNGIVATLVRRSHIQQGALMAIGAIMTLTLGVISVAAAIAAVVQYG